MGTKTLSSKNKIKGGDNRLPKLKKLSASLYIPNFRFTGEERQGFPLDFQGERKNYSKKL